jgi:signal transduction histidine kinase/ligand-binding sensor domain-containing protein
MKNCRLCWLLLLMLQITSPSFSQDTKIVALTKYTQNEGLSSYFVTKLLKDSYGFMWIGTQEGLNLFDGKNFTVFSFQSKEKNRLGGSFVSEIVEDKKRGLLWVNTTYGDVCAIDLNTRTVTRRITADRDKVSLTNKWVRSIAIRGDILWLAGLGVLSAFDLQKGEFIATDLLQRTGMNAADANIAKMTVDNRGRIWIFSDGYGIAVLDSTYKLAGTIRTLNNGLPEKTKLRFWDVTFKQQMMYVGTSWGLRVFDTGNPIVTYVPNKSQTLVDTVEIFSLGFSSSDRLFFSAPNEFYSYDFSSGHIRSYRDQDTEEDWLAVTYQVLYDTATQQLWAGTQSGLALFQDQRTPFTSFSKSPVSRMMIKHAYSLLPFDDHVYCGDANGLFYVNTTTKEIEKIYSGASNFLLFRNNDGNAFLSNATGFYSIDEKNVKPVHLSFPSLLPLEQDFFNSAVQYNDSLVLFGSVIQKGLTVWNKRSNSITRYHNDSTNHRIPELSIINNLYKNSSGQVLILTEKSVISFNPLNGQNKIYSIKNEKTGEVFTNLMDICETADCYWIGTYGNGLIQTDKNFRLKKLISTSEGLSNDCVYKVFSYNNSIIATSNFGLNLIDANTFHVYKYYKSDGLHESAFEQVCGYQYKGKIYAGGVNGFTIIDPSLLFANARAPQLYLGKITVQTSRNNTDTFNLSLNELTIPNNVLQVTISLSGLNFKNPARTSYAYKRSGDDGWTELGTQNFISFIGLPPGRHTFLFRSANEAGVYSQQQVALNLVYLPKWYQHILFKILVALLVAAALYALYRNRLAQLKKQQQIRKDIASDLHDDIGSILNSVKIYTHLAKREPKNPDHLDKIEDSLVQATLGLRDMLWVLDDSGDTVYGVMERIKKYALPVCHAKDIEFESSSSTDVSGKMLTKAEKRNLLLIAKEAINNSIKYADCKHIQVELKQTANKTTLIIKDDGKGFDASIANGGNGLKNIQYRAQQIKAVAKIWSEQGQGTVVEMVKG